MTIGQRIKTRRLALGLSAEEVGQAIGKDRATIYRYEGDMIKQLPATLLAPLAKVLRLTPSALMGWEETAFPLSAHEKEVIAAYHLQPALQSAVDRILGVAPLYNVRAAHALPTQSEEDVLNDISIMEAEDF